VRVRVRVRVRVVRVRVEYAHLGREVDGAKALDALGEGAVGLVGEELA
jgi:hypothetical protein